MKKKTEPLPVLFGITPKKLHGGFLWKKGPFLATARPTTVPAHTDSGEKTVYWAWSCWFGTGPEETGNTREGAAGCIAALQEKVQDAHAECAFLFKMLTGLLKR